ncbi:MAG: hypothetical protein EBZ48_08025 [Proteobacteria bacterium]|nr:hypothetical protein [Pseudomonadota bacterium]
MEMRLRPTSALNLTLEGSTGSFRVGGTASENKSLEVKYLLTSITLDYERGTCAQILDHLAPVRELFETEKLSFDEIMQRDIDDARVSADLIPYLLDNKTRDLVKLFPPIVVIVLPREPGTNRPAHAYPPVTYDTVTAASGEHQERITRAGSIGEEVFEFTQPLVNGKLVSHDFNRLKINTARTKLVIVDGQHRAMALLAIHRNLAGGSGGWSDERRSPYADFYQEWTPSYIRSFQLADISLPVMFCTIPELNTEYSGDYDLRKAARAIFLTLNKNAKKVSESRNRLLDDNDLVALMLRDTLSKIKARDASSPNSLRIHNVELDQSHDRLKLESPIAITGVNHIYYIVEHTLLSEERDVNGARPREGKFWRRKDLGAFGAYARLDGIDILGREAADASDREFFSREVGEKLSTQFATRYGKYVVEYFISFGPCEAHCKASLALEQHIRLLDNRKLRPILFEGQGMSQAFVAHRATLKEKLRKGDFGGESTQIEEIIRTLEATAKQVGNAIEHFRNGRIANFIDQVSDKNKLRTEAGVITPVVQSFINHLYDNVLCTVAFQTAVICGFFGVWERGKATGRAMCDQDLAFAAYLRDIEALLVPKTVAQLKTLIEVFAGHVEGEPSSWQIVESPHTFREVVYPGEMQPDQWPKYRYMMLELWKPEDAVLKDVVNSERNKCRGQIFNSLQRRLEAAYLKTHLRRPEDLTSEETNAFVEGTFAAMKTLLNNLGWNVSQIPKKKEMIELAKPEVGGASPDRDDEGGEGTERDVMEAES